MTCPGGWRHPSSSMPSASDASKPTVVIAGATGFVGRALAEQRATPTPRASIAFRSSPQAERRVRSVQRMALSPGRDAAWAADEYVRWLPTFFRGLMRVEVGADRTCRFRLVGVGVLLELTPAPARSTPDRQLFYVTGGLLARPTRFELRRVLDGSVMVQDGDDSVWLAPRAERGRRCAVKGGPQPAGASTMLSLISQRAASQSSSDDSARVMVPAAETS